MLYKPKNIEVSLHKIYATDGLELDGILFEPKEKTNKIIIHVHGKEGHFIQNHFVTHMGYAYPLSNYSFLTFNNRGHDYMADVLKKSSNGFEWTTHGAAYEQIEEASFDINGVVEYVLRLGYKEIILQGHSLGPHKISYYLANNPKYDIDKVILLSPGDIRYLLDTSLPNWREFSKKSKEMIDNNEENDLMPVKLWSNSPVSAKTFWHYTRPDSNTWIFNFTNPNEKFKFFDSIEKPILTIFPEDDFANGIPAEEAVKILQKKTVSKNFTSVVIKGAVHNFASREKELIGEIVDWLGKFK